MEKIQSDSVTGLWTLWYVRKIYFERITTQTKVLLSFFVGRIPVVDATLGLAPFDDVEAFFYFMFVLRVLLSKKFCFVWQKFWNNHQKSWRWVSSGCALLEFFWADQESVCEEIWPSHLTRCTPVCCDYLFSPAKYMHTHKKFRNNKFI